MEHTCITTKEESTCGTCMCASGRTLFVKHSCKNGRFPAKVKHSTKVTICSHSQRDRH